MKAYGGSRCIDNIFLTSALGGGEWSALPPYTLDGSLGRPQIRSGRSGDSVSVVNRVPDVDCVLILLQIVVLGDVWDVTEVKNEDGGSAIEQLASRHAVILLLISLRFPS
jgi:hypothetical protein